MTPDTGAMTFPRLSTFSSTADSCSREETVLCIPASSWDRVASRWALADWRESSAWSISI